MIQVQDARICFYLKHQRHIDEWAALGREAMEQAHEFFVSCADDVEALAEDIGDGCVPWTDPQDTQWPFLGLAKEVWLRKGQIPVVMISVGWHKPNVAFAGPHRPYFGVHVAYETDEGRTLRSVLRPRIAAVCSEEGYDKNSYWPAWRRIAPPSGEYWKDLGQYRDSMLSDLRTAWDQFAEHADAVFIEAGGG